MFALRSFARAVPRVASRIPAARAIPRSFAAQPSTFVPKQSAFKTFSTSTIRREPAGESDALLAEKFASEQRLEVEERDPTDPPPEVQSFLADSPYQIEDVTGTQIVTLTRKFGNETIKIAINIADMNQIDEDFDGVDEDPALDDEMDKPVMNQRGAKDGKFGTAAEDGNAPSEGEEGYGNESFDESSYPLGLNITITKPSAGAILIRAVAEDGAIEISNVNYVTNADLLEPKSADAAREAEAIYEGPPFMNLDQELQTMLYQYLEERDINAQLAAFLPDYVNFKEQREYVQWLENMKKFVEV